MKVKRKLTKISFDFDKAHLAYTSEDQGGACSLMNDPILLKSLEQGKELSVEQMSLLEAAGYDISTIGKSMEEATKPSASETEASEVNKTNHKDEDNMSEKLEKELAELRKQLAESKVENTLTSYSLDAELKKELASVLAGVEDNGVVFKAFDALIAAGEAKVEAEVTKAKEEIEKAAASAGEENPLTKELGEDAGEGGESEAPVEKSRSDRVAAYL